MVLIEDKAQKDKKHEEKHMFFEKMGIEIIRYPLPVADYIKANSKVIEMIERKKRRGIEVKKIDFMGTYDVCVDTKFSIQEIISDICGKQHDRFRDECVLAKNAGITLYILVENTDGVLKLDDLDRWENPRAKMKRWIKEANGSRKQVFVSPNATKGTTLAKAMRTMQEEYGVQFLFCRPEDTGQKILELLGAIGNEKA